MQYDRFLEIHLVSSDIDDESEKLDPTSNYQYSFKGDVASQARAYTSKLKQTLQNKAARFDEIAGLGAGFRMRRLGAPAVNSTELATVFTPQQGPIPNLESQHYVSCYVDLESLKPGEPLLPRLEALVAWVSAENNDSGRPNKGKLRLNSHGSDKAGAGLLMGGSSLSPEDLVDALVRHGLGTRDMKFLSARQDVVAKESRWKRDAEVNKCENCQKAFSFTRRRHHCRRCGGIFCDACTTKRRTLRNPLTEQGRATGSVDDCRVCDDCASKAEVIRIGMAKSRTGLAQITLALCLSARTTEQFASMKAGFARNSIAGRLVKQLSKKGIHGIQVSGLNEVLAWNQADRFNASFGVEYPGQSRDKKPGSGPNIDPFEGTDMAGSLFENVSMTIPSSILGSRAEPGTLRIPAICDVAEFIPVRDIKIMPCCGGNKLAFGVFTAEQAALVRRAYSHWKFSAWVQVEQLVGGIPELSRAAVELGNPTEANAAFFTKAQFGALKTPTTPAMAATSSRGGENCGPRSTILLSAPQRRIHIEWARNDPKAIVVSGLEERSFKDYKVYEVT